MRENILTLEDESYLRRASVVALRRVGALRQGLHRAALANGSTEFYEHRAYAPGDSLRHLDWRILAKSRRPYVKRFHDPSVLEATLVLDASESMRFQSHGVPRIHYARRVAVFLTRLLLGQRDPVGLFVCSDGNQTMVESSATRTHGNLIEKTLLQAQPRGKTFLAEGLAEFASTQRKASHLVIITDGLVELSQFNLALRKLASHRHQVMLLQLLSPEEIDLQLSGPTRFRCMETGEAITASAETIRSQYQSRLRAHQRALQTAVERIGGTLDVLRTDTSAGKSVTEALLRRQQLSSGGSVMP